MRQESGDSDTQLLVDALADHQTISSFSGNPMADALAAVLPTVVGAFSIVTVTANAIHAARDPQGFRPLCIGSLGSGWVIASETAALDAVGASDMNTPCSEG